MARIVMEMYIKEVGAQRDDERPMGRKFVTVDTIAQAEQIAREMSDHFAQVAGEDPAALAVADALAHPPVEYEKDPYRFYATVLKETMEMVGRARASLDGLTATTIMRFQSGEELDVAAGRKKP